MCFLFSGVCSYKNVIGAHRASWRIISSIEQKEETRGNVDHVTAMKEYRSKIEGELSETCGGILKLLYEKLIPVAANGDSKPGAPETENFFPPNCCLVKKMTESKGNFEKTTNKQQKKDRNLLAFTGAATLLAVTVSFAISAINSRRKKSKKRDLPDSAVLVNLSASEILKLANRIIAKSKEVHDLVASIPLDKVTYANAIAPLVNLEAQQFPLIQSCVFPKLVSPFEDVRKASAEAERRIDGHFSTCSKREDVYRVVKAFAVLMSPETKHYVKCL